MSLKCIKCGGELVEGFILDIAHGSRFASSWVAGKPEKSFWAGTKLSGKEQHPIQSFRCSSCGYLESYAGDMGEKPPVRD